MNEVATQLRAQTDRKGWRYTMAKGVGGSLCGFTLLIGSMVSTTTMALDALCVDHTVDGCVRGDRFAPIDGPPSSSPGRACNIPGWL